MNCDVFGSQISGCFVLHPLFFVFMFSLSVFGRQLHSLQNESDEIVLLLLCIFLSPAFIQFFSPAHIEAILSHTFPRLCHPHLCFHLVLFSGSFFFFSSFLFVGSATISYFSIYTLLQGINYSTSFFIASPSHGTPHTFCKLPGACLHLLQKNHVCLDACRCRTVGCRRSSRGRSCGPPTAFPRTAPVYHQCPCRDPRGCHRVQDDSVAKRQPIVVLVGVLMYCDRRVRRRDRETRSCVTHNTYTPAIFPHRKDKPTCTHIFLAIILVLVWYSTHVSSFFVFSGGIISSLFLFPNL